MLTSARSQPIETFERGMSPSSIAVIGAYHLHAAAQSFAPSVVPYLGMVPAITIPVLLGWRFIDWMVQRYRSRPSSLLSAADESDEVVEDAPHQEDLESMYAEYATAMERRLFHFYSPAWFQRFHRWNSYINVFLSTFLLYNLNNATWLSATAFIGLPLALPFLFSSKSSPASTHCFRREGASRAMHSLSSGIESHVQWNIAMRVVATVLTDFIGGAAAAVAPWLVFGVPLLSGVLSTFQSWYQQGIIHRAMNANPSLERHPKQSQSTWSRMLSVLNDFSAGLFFAQSWIDVFSIMNPVVLPIATLTIGCLGPQAIAWGAAIVMSLLFTAVKSYVRYREKQASASTNAPSLDSDVMEVRETTIEKTLAGPRNALSSERYDSLPSLFTLKQPLLGG